jgi:hypothetical protein
MTKPVSHPPERLPIHRIIPAPGKDEGLGEYAQRVFARADDRAALVAIDPQPIWKT